MTLEELKTRRDKIEMELQKIEEKKKELLSKQKEVNLQITVQEAKKATRVMELVEGMFGEMTEDNLTAFKKMLEENTSSIKKDFQTL